MKKVLITGGSGFIGSSLADKLLEGGYAVINIDNMDDYYSAEVKGRNIENALKNKNYYFYKVDICDFDKMNEVFNNHKIDIIVHLAARAGVRPSIANPLLYQHTNCMGTNIIFELANMHNIQKIISASSSSVYGNNGKTPFNENDIVDYSISPYAASKKANEVLGHVYHALYNIDIVFLRFFTVYGPRQRPDLAIHKFVHAIINDKKIEVFGDGTSARDYTFIEDIVDGIRKTIDYLLSHRNVFEIINLGSERPVNLLEMIRIIEFVLHKKAQIVFADFQQGDVNITYADIDKAKRVLGYIPKTEFADGIYKFVEWYKGKANK
jgi:UDP-glucuronate 4-epimerase